MIGGLIGRAILLREQMKEKPCKRCGLNFDPVKIDKCPRCTELNEKELAILFEKRESESSGNRNLGTWFFITALCLLFLMTSYWLY